MQERSVPASSVASSDASAGQRISEEPDAALPVLALAPVLDVVPADVPLPVAAPIVLAVAAPTEVLLPCTMLLPPTVLLVALLLEVVVEEFVPAAFEGVLAGELALLPTWVLFDRLEVVPEASVPPPLFVVVPVVCARAGVARSADRTRAAVRERMAINPYWCGCQRRAAA